MASPDVWTCSSSNTPIPKRNSVPRACSSRIRLQTVAFHILATFPVFWGIETLLAEQRFSSHDNILTQYAGHFIAFIATCSSSIIWSGLCLLLHGYISEAVMKLGSAIQDVVMASSLALFSMMVCYRSFVVQSFSTIDCIVLGAGILAL
jgi:phage-related protein